MKKTQDAIRPRSGQRKSLKYRILDWLTALLIAVGAVCLLLFVVFTPVRVRSSGVSDFNNGDLVFADRLSKFIFGFDRGDAVVVRPDADAPGSSHIARVIARAGERVVIADGRVYVDGSLLDESAYAELFGAELRMELEIPQGSLLLLPDERAELNESDVESCVVKLSDVVGEVRLIAFPLKRIGFFR